MTTSDLSSNVGRVGLISTEKIQSAVAYTGLTFQVRITDFKVSYGNPRYLITPVSGTGSQWVSAERVQFMNETKEENGQ